MTETFRKYLPWGRAKLRYWLLVAGLLLADIARGPFLLGILVLVIGMALHLWAKGCLRQNQSLAVTGPYCWVRHPFYLANALIELGLCLMINQLEVLLIYFFFWTIAYWTAMKTEEKKLEILFGPRFTVYKSNVPCFVPRRIPDSECVRRGFSWHNPNIAEGSVLPRLLRLAGYPLLFYFGSEFRALGTGFFTEFGLGVVALWGFLFLCCMSYSLKLRLKKQKFAMPEWLQGYSARNVFVFLLVSYAFLFQSLEVEMDYMDFFIGALLSASLFVLVLVSRRSIESTAGVPILVEGVILIVICFLAELPWLSFLPLSYYSALWVNTASETDTMISYGITRFLNGSWIRLQVILTVGVGLMVWKESFDDLRGFLLTL